MTREEQLKEYLKERNIPIDSLEANSIREGIEWADEHPNLHNDEIVDKACNILWGMLFEPDDNGGIKVASWEHDNLEDFIIGFRRKLEE